MKICAILRNAETIQVVHWRKSCFYTFQFEVPFKFHSSFVSLLGTSQIFHLALHFIAGEGMKCFPCLADSFLICPGALGFPTSCTICGALAPNGPGASRYTLYDQHPRYSQTPAIYPARIKKIQMQLSWCYLPLSPDFLNWLFFFKWIIKKHKDLLVLVSWVFNIEDQLKWKLTKKLNKKISRYLMHNS